MLHHSKRYEVNLIFVWGTNFVRPCVQNFVFEFVAKRSFAGLHDRGLVGLDVPYITCRVGCWKTRVGKLKNTGMKRPVNTMEKDQWSTLLGSFRLTVLHLDSK